MLTVKKNDQEELTKTKVRKVCTPILGTDFQTRFYLLIYSPSSLRKSITL